MIHGSFSIPQEPLVRDDVQGSISALPYHDSGHPKPITYTHEMMAIPDIAASLMGIKESYMDQYAFKRWYTPIPLLHVGVLEKVKVTLLTTDLQVCWYADDSLHDWLHQHNGSPGTIDSSNTRDGPKHHKLWKSRGGNPAPNPHRSDVLEQPRSLCITNP